MLYEIICDKFKQKRVALNTGLNTILGPERGDNSIGKSTFLLIIDFVYGGNTYAESNDIIKNVGNHEMYFAFNFDSTIYRFCRAIPNEHKVWICDENYKKIDTISLDDFCMWLDKKYDVQMPYLSFRNSVGRYMRVYGKDNANEKLPLHIVPNEKNHEACYALLKLFNFYMPIHHLATQASVSSDELKSYTKAQRLHFIDNINKSKYIKNKRAIETLSNEIDELTKSMEFQISNLSVETSEAAILLKKALSNARRERSRIRLRLESLTEDFEYKFSATTNDLSALQEFFPAVDLEKLESVEKFHKTISKIFKNEIKKECNKLTLELEDCNALIKDYEDQLEELIGNPTISKTILHRHSELIRQIDSLKLANSRYDKLTELQKNNREDKDNLDAIEKEQFAILQNTINSKMKEVNDYIYDKSCNAPIIDFSNGNYTFFTPDDTGTGIAYKGLVVFDLAVLELTPLPAIVHDSIVLKQISDTAIERILELYEKSGKQVFISLDKHNSYTEKAGKILVEKSVLCLAPNGSELFGRSWG